MTCVQQCPWYLQSLLSVSFRVRYSNPWDNSVPRFASAISWLESQVWQLCVLQMELWSQPHLVPAAHSSSFWLVSDTVPSCMLGASLCCSNFLTCAVLQEYWAPSWDCTIKLFPCLLTTVYGVRLNRDESLFFSPVELIPGLQEVRLGVLHLSLSEHKTCSYSSVRCPCHLLLALHGHHSALEVWCVSFGQRLTQLGSHRLLGEVRLCKLQDRCWALFSSSSSQHVRSGVVSKWAILALNLPLAWGHLAVTLWCLIPCCTMYSETLLIWTAVLCRTSGLRVSHVVQTSLLGLRWP